MDRVDAIAKYIINQTKKNREDLGFILIGEIYDDFESRTCENCKYLDDRNDGIYGCFKLIIKVQPVFGCNKFERKKTNDTRAT